MSTKSTYEDIKSAIPFLSQREIKDLMNRCKVLLKTSTVDNPDWLLEGIIQELRMNGVLVPSFDKIKKLPIYNSFAEKSEQLRTTLEDQGIKTVAEKRQLSTICAKCLIEYVRSFTDVSLHTMLAHIDKLPQALERAFPGYIASKMLRFVVKSNTLH